MTRPARTSPSRAPARSRPATPAGEHRPAPWVRTRLRTQPLAALLTAALAFALVFLAAAFPRALDRGADAALRDFLHDRGPLETSLTSTASAPLGDRAESAADLERVAAELLAATGPGYSVAPSGAVFGAQAVQHRALANPGLDRPDGRSNPTLHLLYLHGLTEHTTLVAGAWPGRSAPGEPIPIAVSRAAADTIGIRLGDVLQDDSATSRQVRVSGLYTVTDQAEPYWSDLPCTGRACLERSLSDPNTRFWHTAGIVGGDDLRTLAAWGGRPARDFWRLPVDTGALRADRLPEAQRGLASHLTGPAAAHLGAATARPDLTTVSRLPGHLAQAAARQGAVAPLAAIGPAAVAGIAGIVLALAAALTTERRGAELRLLRARGASAAGVLLRLCGEAAVPVLPAAATATALALWLLPTPRWTAAVTAALVTTVLALFTVPVRAALPPGQDRHRGRAARRVRLCAETVVLALTAAAVAGERRRGAAPPGDGPDLLLVAAPLLIALTAALLLARLLPLLAAAAARAAARGPALVGFLGLARAARGTGGRPRPSTLPLFALVLAVTTAGFGSTVLDGVGLARRQAARLTVGADASAAAPAGRTLPPGFGPAAAALPGVEAATTVRLESEAFLLEGVPGVGTGVDPHATQVTLVVAEPQAYARIARTVGTGTFDPALLTAPPAPDTAGPAVPGTAPAPGTAAPAVPALFSADLARHLGPGGHRLRLPSGGEVLAVRAGAVDATPALPGATRPFIVLPTPAATAVLPELARATDWFAVGRIDEPALAALVRQLPPSDLADPGAPPTAGPTASAAVVGNDPDALRSGYLTRTSAAVTADLARDPLQHAAARFFRHAVTAAGALALLALLLTLLRAAPDRAALLARLRTMGLRSRQGLALILAETLPQTLTAAAGGALAALAAVALLGPAVDLSALVGAPVPAGLRPAAGPLVLPAAALAALAALAVLTEALTGGRRQVTTHLRAGDHP
ncbi:hypothetical protein J5Y04_15655 [Kitasatospora sp. RG8]|uniref:hypothetical protein n=1 Tax=Kitasatospora sp. RG8 TaxID=2820815 RepID=UPI001ADEDDFB|nr:hypothetical protein [Kitasatospora sp. RG8]MBP0450968.1 hypothetical protein [Kitasatospora sp. RG8]